MKVLTKRSQMFFYAIAAFGVNLMNLIMGSYLCSALLVGDFAVADIPYHTYNGNNLVIATAWAILGVVAKIIDGVIDIPMASFTDNLRSKFGRRRPAILMGMIPMIISYCLFLVIPNPTGATVGNTIWFFAMLAIFYSSYTLTMVTYYATFTEIVDNERDRSFISNVKSVCDIVYFTIGYVVVAMMLKGINIRYVALILLPLVLLMLIPIFMIKEKSTLERHAETTRSVNLFKSLGYTFKDKAFIAWMVVYFFMTFGVQLFLGGINEYFSATGMSMIYVMTAAFAPVPFTLMLYNKLIKKFGFRFAFQYVVLVFALGSGLMFGISFMPDSTLRLILAILSGLICSFAIGSMFAVAYSIPSQLAADDEKRTGISHSAMYFAVQGLFAGVASGIGGYAVLTALKTHAKSPYITLITAIACVAAFALTFILPRSIVLLGKEEKAVLAEENQKNTEEEASASDENN